MRSIIRSAIAAVVAAGLMGVAPLPAAAARPAPPPTVQVDAAVDGFDVAVTHSVNRASRQVVGQECEVVDLVTEAATSVTCDSVSDRRSNARQSLYSLLAEVTTVGQYEFRVEFALADGAVASGSDTFEIEPGPVAAFEVSGLRNQTLYSSRPVPSQLVVVEAVDEYGNLATGCDGTVTFDGDDYEEFEVLPADSQLTKGRGVFAVNVGSSQNDCLYGDIAQPDCLGFWRVTATDTADPNITGFQRVSTTVVITSLPSNFITPEGGVCPTCLADPADAVSIDTGEALVLKDMTLTFLGEFLGTLEGVTTSGVAFTATVSGTALVGDVGGNLNVMVPASAITSEITIQDLDTPESDFGSVKVEVPYENPDTGQTETVFAYTTLFSFQQLVCEVEGC